ncbi:hypothetical protein [Streptomyces sp. NPDC049040]|uniref:hypothetical protein n=1 Tax=Streptomyces sp. NPDC049040 TaxID=3365593 RepID=UPI0037112422
MNDWVEGLRARLGDGESVLGFDPASGGVEARSLFLLEPPGQKAMGAAPGPVKSRRSPDD